MELNDLVAYARKNKCSDMHLTAGTPVAIRRYGTLTILKDKPSISETEAMIYGMLDDYDKERVMKGEDVDVSTTDASGGRLRVNVYHQRNNLAASIRLLDSNIPTFEELNMPVATMKALCEKKSGLVLVTGPTGSGKSTTLASMLDYINNNLARHIITIEDPIEYTYQYRKSMIHQRQLGKDVADFATALRSSIREDPDVIMVGEMRDYETINAAITAAETGHLVLSTLHTKGAAPTVERIIAACPIEARDQVQLQLSNILEGVITQTLIPCETQEGRIAAHEIMLRNPAICNLIRENKVHQIQSTIQSNMSMGMHTMNHSLEQLYRQRIISRENALAFSEAPIELAKLI